MVEFVPKLNTFTHVCISRREMELTDSQFDQEKGDERVAALGGGIARIKVGAATETELKDKKLR